jgi:hypothetical protein
MIPHTFIQLEPSTGSNRCIRSGVRAFTSRLGCRSILISGAGNVGAMPTDLSFVRGAYDWKIPDGPLGSLGFLAYHPVDEHCDSAFMCGNVRLKFVFLLESRLTDIA